MDSLLPSPRIKSLHQAIVSGDSSALAGFWKALAQEGAPIFEPAPDDHEHSLVTFVWRAPGEGPAPAVVSALPGRDTTDPLDHLPGTDVWRKTYRVRNDTRKSYQFAVGGKHVTDPLNPRQHIYPNDDEAGFKGWVSSVLELPEAPPERWSRPRQGVPAGRLEFHPMHSGILAREYRTWVYTPPGYSPESGPYGLAVFLDTHELLFWARANNRLTDDPSQTTLVGCSLGGLMAAFVGLHNPHLFGNILCQSAHFGWRSPAEPEDGWLIRQYVANARQPLRFYIDAGRLETHVDTWDPGFGNFLAAARHMRDVLRAKGYEAHYHEFSGAHNRMNWPETLPLGLMALRGLRAL